MGDGYKHDPQGVATVIKTLSELTNRYKEKIVELTSLVNNINNSPLWKDKSVKTEFIKTCNSYIKIYNNLARILDSYVEYLKKKSNGANNIENAFMGGKV